MITKPLNWVKQNKLLTLLFVVLLFLLLKPRNPVPFFMSQGKMMETSVAPGIATFEVGADASMDSASLSYAPMPRGESAPPVTGVANRMVIQNSYLSLLVKDVVSVRQKVVDYATTAGGYMVNTETTNPSDAPTATVSVRVPVEKMNDALTSFRSYGVKVVSENILGTDVTDQYVDIDARIETLEKTKTAMESILSQATAVTDLANITREVISIQSQIDALVGQQKSLSENAKLAKITLYLSTDEIALPYAPTETFRPEVIIKLAIRSLVSHLRQLATAIIWIAIYGVIWIPVLLIFIFFYKRTQK